MATALLVVLSSCGRSEEGGGDAPPPPGAAVASANEPGAVALLARLRERATAGTGLADAGWNQDVAQLQRLLWPGMESEDAERGTRAHVALCQVAASVGAWLAKDEKARALEAEPDAVSREIHGAWLDAAMRTPDAYRAWCAKEGAALLERLEDERRRRLFGDR